MSPAVNGPSGPTQPDATSYQRLREHLAYLELTAASEHLAAELDRGLAEQASPTQVLERLLEIEVAATRARRQRARLRFAHYPVHKTLAGFDFDFQPQLDRALVAELSTLRFVEERRNVLLLGPPGVGKSHLAIALGIAATEAGYRTFFTTAADMVHTLQAAHLAGTVLYKLRSYLSPSVLVVSRRADKGSIILTSNRGFADWGQVFADPVVATAIIDRLLGNAAVLNICGKSYRMRAYQALAEAR
jgi:DNA replication protein DnaC